MNSRRRVNSTFMRYLGEMKQISIGDDGLCALVDDEDYDFLAPYTWTARKSYGTIYAHANVQSDSHGWVNVAMHRMIIGDVCEDWTVPVKPASLANGKKVFVVDERFRNARKMSVDHIDGNGLNNCRL